MTAYMEAKEKAGYKKCIDKFMEDLNQIRLSCQIRKKSRKVKYQLEKIPKHLKKTTKVLGVTNDNIRIAIDVGGYA